MKISSTRKKLIFSAVSLICAWILFITPVLSLAGCTDTKRDIKNEEYINYINFSNDSKKIIFNRRIDKGPDLIHVYNLETHELAAYQSPPEERWSMGSYSPDGKEIVFSIFPRDRSQTDKMQLAIMTPDGNKIKKITSTNGPKIYPSFSHTGDKIIFAKGEMRKSGRTPAAGFDFYEVDIKTREETRLTWFKLFSISPPKEFPDGITIIFGAYGFPGMSAEIENTDNIFMVKKGERKLPVPLVRLDSNNSLILKRSGTKNPLISSDGKLILFQGDAQDPDGIHGEGDQYYNYAKVGKYRRLTYLITSTIWSAAFSPDGQYLAVVIDPVFDKSESKKIAICNIKDGTSRIVDLPDHPSRIINQY